MLIVPKYYVELAFKTWTLEQEPVFITEDWLDNLSKLTQISPQLAKYLPFALKEIDQDPELRTVVQNRSLFLALYHAFRRVTQPEFMQALKRVSEEDIQIQVQQLPFKDLAKTEIIVREQLIPVWRIIVRILDLFHITGLVTNAVPKFKEFIDCFVKLDKEKQQFRILAQCAASAFLQFIHQVISTTFFSGLAAKIVAILGMLGLAAKMTSVILVVWVLLLILQYIKGKIDPTRSMALVIGLIIKIFSPGHGKEEKPKRPPIFTYKTSGF